MDERELLKIIEEAARDGGTELNMMLRYIRSLPGEIGKLTELTDLNLRGNELKSLPTELWELRKLTWLSVSQNLLENLPAELGKLTELRKLYLYDNRLTSLPAELGKLTKLTDLNIENNQLVSLPAELGNLKELTNLNLKGNRLTDISALKSLTSLKELDLRGNKIKELPKWITELGIKITWDTRSGIMLEGNPLETPPVKIVTQGREAITRYFRQLSESQKRTQKDHYLFEAKLLIIGEAGAGKTTFARKLRDPNAKMPTAEESTHGIDVSKWTFEITQQNFPKLRSLNINKTKFYLNLWDFGGQEIYHGTHQFFFSEDSLYVILADTRKQEADFNYWLLTTEQLAGNSPLMIVLNKRERREWRIDRTGLMSRYGEIIREIMTVDLSQPQEIPDLQKSVKYWFSFLQMIGDKLPESWVDIREKLLKEERRFITYKEFQDICTAHGMTDIKDVEVLSNYYDKIGVITHFLDDPILKERVYIDSNWLVKTIYHLLDDENVKKQHGRLTAKQIKKIWRGNEIYQEVDKLVQLMLRFGLLFKVKDQDEYIVPEHLMQEKPYERWPYDDGEILEFQYEFGKYMPRGLMAQLIVELHHHIKDYDLIWWRGVNVEYDGAKAEVLEIYGQENKFVIRVSGENRRNLLVIIREHFERIIRMFKKLEPNKLVPCNCPVCMESSDPKFHLWAEIRNLANRHIRSLPCGKSGLDVDIYKLLGEYGAVKMEERNKEDKRGGYTFNVYSKGARHIQPGADYVEGKQTKTRDIHGKAVAIGDGIIEQKVSNGNPSNQRKNRNLSIIWRIAGFFVAVFLLAISFLYVPQWRVKAALIAGAVAASLSIIFNPRTWHRRTALCLLLLVGAAQIGFGLYGNYNPSQEKGGGGYLVLSEPAVIVQALIILAAITIYIIGEIFSKRNE